MVQCNADHLEVALHRSVQYRSVGGGGGDTVCTPWFSAMLIIWRLPYTGQYSIDQWGGGGYCLHYMVQCNADHLEVALHRSVQYRSVGGGGGGYCLHYMVQ